MNRWMSVVLLLIPAALFAAGSTPGEKSPVKSRSIKVAMVLSPRATVIDFAGPWEVFQDVMVENESGQQVHPFELYTVAPSKEPIHTSGGDRGLTITPDYSFDDAPIPDIVVVGAQVGGPGFSAWLQKVHDADHMIMSVCTGAYKLAKAGLLDGKPATTHHWYLDNFQETFPKVKLVSEVRYVEADPITFTAGGLSSGIDLALHVVAKYFGDDAAQATADYMEYQSTGWKSNEVAAQFPTPITRADWSGKLASGAQVVMHMVTRGASQTFTTDFPAEKRSGVATTVSAQDKDVTIEFDIPGQPATMTGTVNDSGDAVIGTFEQGDMTSPLTLERHAISG